AMMLSATAANAADYVIDTKGGHASVNFKIKHLGYSWLYGRFNTFDGTFSYDAKNPDASKIMVNIDTTSLDSNHAERDKHL
ncbi:YceI family protein, partial [Pseudoalteromonas sp. Q18-MNA-CIBAN-0097]